MSNRLTELRRRNDTLAIFTWVVMGVIWFALIVAVMLLFGWISRANANEPCQLTPTIQVELRNVQAHQPMSGGVYRLSLSYRVDRGEWRHIEQANYEAEPTLRLPTVGVGVGIRDGFFVEFAEVGTEVEWR